MKKCRRRKCLSCGELFLPDYRNRQRQSYCSDPSCRKASKAASQAKWRASSKGCDYFGGPENVRRVQLWRKAHPGYWKTKSSTNPSALQDRCSSQHADNQQVNLSLVEQALQDACFSQTAFIAGLMSSLTGDALQENIAGSIRRFHAQGQRILGMRPSLHQQGVASDDSQVPHQPSKAPPHSQAV